MRKRSRYRPKPVLVDPVGYVLESIKPVKDHDDYLLILKVKNHDAMTSLTRGIATQQDIEILIAMMDAMEALNRMGFKKGWEQVIKDGLYSLEQVGKRGAQTGKFILRAQEMNDLNNAMVLHDEMMEIITVKDMERAIDMVNKEFEQGKTRKIVEKGNER